MQQTNDEIKFNEILDSLDEKNRIKLKGTYDFARLAHEGQFRKSGEEYFTHPLAVALDLYEKFNDLDLMIAGLLHDTIEDCDVVTQKLIYDTFGDNVGFIVDSVSKNEKKFYKENIQFDDERDKMLYGGMKNISCILVKLADRNHNLSTLSHLPADKQVKKSFESQAIYIPLMHILEYNKINSIEEISNRFLRYLNENKIDNFKNLKNILLNTSFTDFNEEIFNTVYSNSKYVIWKIEDKKIFDGLVKSGWFDSDAVDITKIETDGKSIFKVYFIFKSGSIFDLNKGKISILNSNFIS